MSRAAKLTLAGSGLFALTTIVVVHFQQQTEKSTMHAGVLRDMDQQRIKRERQLDFDMQRAMEVEYRKVQNVKDGDGGLGCSSDAGIQSGTGNGGGT